MAIGTLSQSLCVSRIEGLRHIISPHGCLGIQIGTLRWGSVTPRCFCSRRLLRVAAARNKRPSLVGNGHQKPKSQTERNSRKGQVTIDHKVWVSLIITHALCTY